MKANYLRKTWLCLIISLLVISVYGQTGKGIHYQAVARSADGEPLVSQELDIKIGIVNTDLDDEVIWLEEQQVTTSKFGLFNLVIGNDPADRIGGTYASFEEINWQAGAYSLNVQVKKPGEDFVDLGTSPILSVPYAYVSEKVQQPLTSFSIQNDGETPPGAALFEVLRADGQPVFAVYEEGVWVYTDTEESKGIKGGFAVGGYNRTGKGVVVEEYMRVTPDSVRIYIDDTPSKGIKGGFAVGGYNRTGKSSGTDYMSVFRDSIRFHVGYEQGKGRLGGFAISGRNPQTGKPATFLFLTPENYFIGEGSGKNITNGKYNTVFGYRAGENITEGSKNVMIGYEAGHKNNSGNANVFIGDSAGYHNLNGSGNVFLGRNVGLLNESGSRNIFLGNTAGIQNLSGKKNIFIGTQAGFSNTIGSFNCFIGQAAGFFSTKDSSNMFIGSYAGAFHAEGRDNIFIGNLAGNKNYSGMANVFIGKQAGQNSDTASFNLAIGDHSGESLRKGEFNVLLGHMAGSSIQEAYSNTILGAGAGERTEMGDWNTFIGRNTGFENITGHSNTYVGGEAGRNSTDGSDNVFIGIKSGESCVGNGNVFLGSRTGLESNGSGNVFIGTEVGQNVNADNILVIDNHNGPAGQGLIFGNFAHDKIKMNAIVGIGVKPDSTYSLKTAGAVNANDVIIPSDARYKINVEPIPGALDLVMNLDGITYQWDRNGFPERNFDEKVHYGFIAQELEEVIPALVVTGSDGYKSVNYQKINTVLVEAIKQQQDLIDEKERRISELESRMERLEALHLK